MPFGPSLAVGVVGTLLAWRVIGPKWQPLFFEPFILVVVGGFGAFFLLVISFVLRLVRGTPPEEPADGRPAEGPAG